MNVLILKTIALISMIIDHYGAIFSPFEMDYRIIGRLAFPIYSFLLVEGYMHTKDIKKYIVRILIFAFISEIPFDFAFYGGTYWPHQNIFFTLAIGLVAMHLFNKEQGFISTKNLTVTIGAATLAALFATDYNFIGIIYITAFFFTRNYKPLRRMLILGFILYVINTMGASSIQQYSLLALPILFFYNKKLGPKNKVLQLLYYAAYPAHLMLFFLLK